MVAPAFVNDSLVAQAKAATTAEIAFDLIFL
jgi:hypothetical protein